MGMFGVMIIVKISPHYLEKPKWALNIVECLCKIYLIYLFKNQFKAKSKNQTDNKKNYPIKLLIIEIFHC